MTLTCGHNLSIVSTDRTEHGDGSVSDTSVPMLACHLEGETRSYRVKRVGKRDRSNARSCTRHEFIPVLHHWDIYRA